MVFSWLGLARHRAVFFDDSGNFVGTKCFKWTFSDSFGISKKSFTYKGGEYNCNAYSSRAIVDHFFVNEYTYFYNVNNPDPFRLSSFARPIMSPSIYKKRLNNQFIEQLHKAGNQSLSSFLTPKNIIVGIIVLGVIYYIISGGDILPK
jgi:hypothetical protein